MRLEREVVGQVVTVERPLLQRLQGRNEDRTPWEEFDLGDSSTMVWDHRPVPMSQFRMPEAGPNAPLLKRVIRYPISMEPEGPKREQVFDGSRQHLSRPSVDRVPMVFRENAEARSARSPIADLDLGPEPIPLPFLRARRAARDREEAARR
ncbi:MAG: hypothetical protein H6737_08090 [Alphaproteobacteria bacterium]|nr:hypothetical protein [Alphaproteobacteria bacterium]